MKRIVLLGSTGSIGVNTLDVVSRFPEKFRVVGLTAGENIELLEKQIRRFRPKFASILREEHVERLKQRCRDIDVEIYAGVEGMIKAAADDDADMVVSAIVGAKQALYQLLLPSAQARILPLPIKRQWSWQAR